MLFPYDSIHNTESVYVFYASTATSGPRRLHCRIFTISLRHATFGKAPLEGWSGRRRDLYQRQHTTLTREISMLSAGFQPVIPRSEWPWTHALDRASTGIGAWTYLQGLNSVTCFNSASSAISNILDFRILPCSECWIFFSDDSPASESYMPMFRNTLLHLHPNNRNSGCSS
jgi:hypothetical protein